ncbi:hypothetical protein [Bacteroides sp. 224]|uniref:hypothetical protein n=1 Tax=Bacteroides sp. 224 TaxID=2302936 RepID=UPI0013D3666A|nr:hypothetical protein [Bacteroides sp. 224]NDV66808.1 hypothetical protein [Bacteroides sp. 224]
MKNNLLLLILISCLSCNNKKSVSTSSTADTITSVSVDVETTDTSDEIYEKPLTFSELVAKVPITPLPFGISRIDTLNIYQPLSDHSLPPYGYDTLNVYKLNIKSFMDYRSNDETDPIYCDEDKDSRFLNESSLSSYLSKRLPPLPTGEEVLLYYLKIREEGSAFWLIVCNQDGKLISELRLFKSDRFYMLSAVDEEYKVIRKHYYPPYKKGEIPEEGFKHLKDEVPEYVVNNNLTVLHYTTEHTISSEEIKRTNAKLYYWRKEIPAIIYEIDNGKVIDYPLIEDDSIAIDFPDSLLASTTDSIKLQEMALKEEVKDTIQVEIE